MRYEEAGVVIPGRRAESALPQGLNELSGEILAAAIEVHRQLGPGLLESIYEVAFDHELRLRGLAVDRQVPVRVRYKDIQIDGQRLGLLINFNVPRLMDGVRRFVL